MVQILADSKLLRLLMCAALVINITLAAALIAGPGQGYSSGIEGNVLKSPETRPLPGSTMAPEKTCPLAVLIIRDAQTSRFITRITTDENGYFSVHLVPGRYTISLESDEGGALLYGKPQEKSVEAGRLTHVTVYADGTPGESRVAPAWRYDAA